MQDMTENRVPFGLLTKEERAVLRLHKHLEIYSHVAKTWCRKKDHDLFNTGVYRVVKARAWTEGWTETQDELVTSMNEDLDEIVPLAAIQQGNIALQFSGWEIVLHPDKTFELVDTSGG